MSYISKHHLVSARGAQWLSGRVLDSRQRGHGFKPHQRHCVVSLSKNISPSLVLVQPRKTCPYITERLLMGPEESNQTNIPTLSEKEEAILLHQPKLVNTSCDKMFLKFQYAMA